MGIQLKGSSQSDSRQTRPIAFKVRVIQLVENEDQSPKEAFEVASNEFDLTITKSMEEYPASIFHSYRKFVQALLDKDDTEAERLVREAGLVGEAEEAEEAEASA